MRSTGSRCSSTPRLPRRNSCCPWPRVRPDRLHTHKIDELARQGRLQLSERDVQRWAAAMEVVTTATNRLYGMLIANDDLRAWADIEYFSAWTLQEKLLAEWYPQPELDTTPRNGIRADSDVYNPGEDGQSGEPEPGAAATQPWAEHRQAVTKALDKFRDDPLATMALTTPTLTTWSAPLTTCSTPSTRKAPEAASARSWTSCCGTRRFSTARSPSPTPRTGKTGGTMPIPGEPRNGTTALPRGSSPAAPGGPPSAAGPDHVPMAAG